MSSIQNTSENYNSVFTIKKFKDLENHYKQLLTEVHKRYRRMYGQYDEDLVEMVNFTKRKFLQNRGKLYNLRGSTLPAFILQNYRNKIFKTQRRIVKELEVLMQIYLHKH